MLEPKSVAAANADADADADQIRMLSQCVNGCVCVCADAVGKLLKV